MEDNIKTILKREPDYIILHVGTNNAANLATCDIKNKIDVFLLSETKIDETFPLKQFLILGFAKPLRLDRNSRGGGIMLFIRNNISFRLLKHGNLPPNT